MRQPPCATLFPYTTLFRSPAEIHGRQRIGDEIADLRLRVLVARLRHGKLREMILDLAILDHFHGARHVDLARLAVDEGADVVIGTVTRARGLAERILHRLEHQLAVDEFLACDRIGDLQKLELVRTDHIRHPLAWAHYRAGRRHPGPRPMTALRHNPRPGKAALTVSGFRSPAHPSGSAWHPPASRISARSRPHRHRSAPRHPRRRQARP